LPQHATHSAIGLFRLLASCLVVIEDYAIAHHWARKLIVPGDEMKLI
jgi:hypothetical protein